VAALGGLLTVISLAWVLATPAAGVAFYALIPIVVSGFG
jgi:hypothetical protein